VLSFADPSGAGYQSKKENEGGDDLISSYCPLLTPAGSHITSSDQHHKHSDPSGVAYLFHRLIAGDVPYHCYVFILLFGNASKALFYTRPLAFMQSSVQTFLVRQKNFTHHISTFTKTS